MNNEEFAQLALTWVDVPYHHQGRSRLGVDCVGLPLAVLAEAGALPDDVKPKLNYGRRPMKDLVAELDKHCIKLDKPTTGCLVSIHWPQHELPGHIAVLTQSPVQGVQGHYMVHAHMRARKVVINRFASPWSDRVTGFWGMPGVTYG